MNWRAYIEAFAVLLGAEVDDPFAALLPGTATPLDEMLLRACLMVAMRRTPQWGRVLDAIAASVADVAPAIVAVRTLAPEQLAQLRAKIARSVGTK